MFFSAFSEKNLAEKTGAKIDYSPDNDGNM
jgi:hypothetical protein